MTTITEIVELSRKSTELHDRYKLDMHKVGWAHVSQRDGYQTGKLAAQAEVRAREMHAVDATMMLAYNGYAHENGLTLIQTIELVNAELEAWAI